MGMIANFTANFAGGLFDGNPDGASVRVEVENQAKAADGYEFNSLLASLINSVKKGKDMTKDGIAAAIKEIKDWGAKQIPVLVKSQDVMAKMEKDIFSQDKGKPSPVASITPAAAAYKKKAKLKGNTSGGETLARPPQMQEEMGPGNDEMVIDSGDIREI
ncbi:MAG: hypothetical protein FWC79_07655 [Oscillospiraceae bacterium]|nr:hypothetical protein [Oscillospiraceae bacterium]